MADLRVPPHNDDAERSVLGAILIDKDAIVAVAEFLRPEHFYKETNGMIYEAILALFEEREPIDLVTLTDKLKKKKNYTKIGGSAYLTGLVNSVPTAANIEHYGRIVYDHFTQRELISAAGKISELAFGEADNVQELLDKAEQSLFSISQGHQRQYFIPVKDALAESFDRLDEIAKRAGGLRGIPTGFRDLDNRLAGMQASNLLILASRPGVGKTALSLNIARHVAVNEKLPVGVFSLEMSKEELVDRLLVAQSGVDAWKLKTGKLEEEDFTSLSEAMGLLAEAPLFIDDTPGMNILEMRTKARRLQAERGLQFLIVDYLQLAHSRNLENRVQEVSEISQGLKNLARELKIPVLACSQLSRAVEVRGGKRPRLADLRESGCLTGESQITRADTGLPVTIKELVETRESLPVFAMGENLKVGLSCLTKAFSSGRKKVFRIIFRSGRELRASANHPFLTVHGWKRLEGIQAGDRLGALRHLPGTEKTQSPVDQKLILLAHFIGDGCYLKHQPVHYTNSREVNLRAVGEAARAAFSCQPRRVKQKNWHHLYFSGDRSRGIKNPISAWFKELGIYDQRSREKEIPRLVFTLPKDQLALFIKHLWATDGNFSRVRGGGFAIYYASTSLKLIKQLQHLLLKFGIASRIKRTHKPGYQDGFILVISSKAQQAVFLKEIGVFGKEPRAREALDYFEESEGNPNLDVIPREVWPLIEEARRKKGLTTREFHRLLGWAYSGTQRHKHGVSRKRLNHILSVVDDDWLSYLGHSDLYWDEILDIKPEGIEEVYDATVLGVHNFVANDVVVHNSIEQDSDVVMFIYEPDEEKTENKVLEIAKHRNGPTGVINMRFVKELVSFFGVEKKRKK